MKKSKKEVIRKRRSVLAIVTLILLIVSFISLVGLAGTVDRGAETPITWILVAINFVLMCLGGLGVWLLSSTND